jgi:hypothetical protein
MERQLTEKDIKDEDFYMDLVRQIIRRAYEGGEGSKICEIFRALEKYAKIITEAIKKDTINKLLREIIKDDLSIAIDSEDFKNIHEIGATMGVMMWLTRNLYQMSEFKDWEEVTKENIRDAAHLQLKILMKSAFIVKETA